MDFSAYLKNKRVLGATLIGVGLVGGSYVIANFGQTRTIPQATPTAVAAAPVRNYIPITDSTGDGVEDWRAEFVARQPVVLTPEKDPIPEFVPETVTDVVGVEVMQNFLRAKAGFGARDNNQIVSNALSRIETVATDPLYRTSDINITLTSNESIRAYGNAMAMILMTNNVPNYEDELTIIDRAVKMESEAEIQKLLPLENMYRQMRDQALRTPVPQSFVKEHLDIINVFNALYAGLRDIRQLYNDPVVALMRTKRFDDDTTGLIYGLQNLYLAFEPHARVFTPDDPALLLVTFSPNFNR